MDPEMEIGTDKKALRINLEATKYGTFAEIGAGQEVARRFFRVGGAAGTIAKTMSAYDMTFSDAIYGHADRYVSRVRLQTMLNHEYNLLIERLDRKFGAEKTFFVFADTVAARSFKKRNESHGWLGVRFQSQPRGQPSEIIIHVRLLDEANVDQQEALGVIGVNLLHGAFYCSQPAKLISLLQQNLPPERIEVDMIKFSGPVFQHVDNRLMSLQLVSQGLTDAVMFKADGETVQPAEVFYKKAILVERGSFRPVTYATNDMLDGARRVFLKHCDCSEDEVVVLDGDDAGEFARRRSGRSRGLSRPRRYSPCARTKRLDLEGRRILSACRISLSLHEQGNRSRLGSAESNRNLQRKILHEPGRWNFGSPGKDVQGRAKTLCL